ncbi:MAG: FG-GAP repeat protein [Acidobacteriales bacterium]|nr:FG-GAP repeat protein [Terriglobales bacterium]
MCQKRSRGWTAIGAYYENTSGARYFATADFNGDGRPDIAVASHFESFVSVMLDNRLLRRSRSLRTRMKTRIAVAAFREQLGRAEAIQARQIGQPRWVADATHCPATEQLLLYRGCPL